MRTKFNFYEDPGHGWLKVKKSELKELKIEDKITGYSYMRKEDVFLEEDQDASTFIKAWELKTGLKFDTNKQLNVSIGDKQSKIRNYNCYINYNNEQLKEIENLKNRMLNYTNWSNKKVIYNASLEDLKFWQVRYNF
jgi:hypothetical protein